MRLHSKSNLLLTLQKKKFRTDIPEGELLLALMIYSKEGANKRGNSSRLTQSFHFFMFEPIFSPVNALNQPI